MKDRAFIDTNILIYGYSVTEPENKKLLKKLPCQEQILLVRK